MEITCSSANIAHSPHLRKAGRSRQCEAPLRKLSCGTSSESIGIHSASRASSFRALRLFELGLPKPRLSQFESLPLCRKWCIGQSSSVIFNDSNAPHTVNEGKSRTRQGQEGVGKVQAAAGIEV